MSPLPGKVTDLLSPCRLTGWRVTDKSSQDAARHEVCLQGNKERSRRVCVWTGERTLTQTVDFSRDGSHELGEKEVCEGPVHEGHLQLLRLQGQTSFHL